MSDTNSESTPQVESRAVTSQELYEKLVNADPATEVAKEPKKEPKPTSEDGTEKKRNSFGDRIKELVDQRRAAETETETAKRESRELRERLERLEAAATPTTANSAKPFRGQFRSDEDFIEALTDWKTTDAIIKRENKQEQDRQQAQIQRMDEDYTKRQNAAMKDIDDYEETLASADMRVSDYVMVALKESDVGPQMAYYFAKHPDELKRIQSMTPTAGLREMGKLENDLAGVPAASKKSTPTVEKSKAPKPPSPVRENAVGDSNAPQDFDDYKAWRQSQMKKR